MAENLNKNEQSMNRPIAQSLPRKQRSAGALLADLLRCQEQAPMSDWWRERYPHADYRCYLPRFHWPLLHRVSFRLVLDGGSVFPYQRQW